MTSTATGVSVIIPTGGTQRLHLLNATLAGLRRSHGVAQIIVSEAGPTAHAAEIARNWDADYVFSHTSGRFNKSRALNLGSALAHQDILVWSDSDIVFESEFLLHACDEFHRRKLDLLQPLSAIYYLSEMDTERVCRGEHVFSQCTPTGDWQRPPGGLSLVRARFLRRHGGMCEDFCGWGCEDEAWIHKVRVLGRMAWTDQPQHRVWHLFHPPSTRDKSNYQQNLALLNAVESISDPTDFALAYPPAQVLAPPWQDMNRIEFLSSGIEAASPASRLAAKWKKWLAKRFGSDPCLTPVEAGQDVSKRDAAELCVVFAETRAAGAALLVGRADQAAILVVMDSDESTMPTLAPGACHWLLPRTAAQAARWSPNDDRVWHRPWDVDTGEAAPVLVQLISHALAQPKRWQVRIAIDRAALDPEALDRAPFWYVGLQDADGAEILRHDADGREVYRLARQAGTALELERTIIAPRPPARWTVWPVDRHRRWLQPVHGEIALQCARPVAAERPA